MFEGIFFFTYIFAGFVGFLVILLVVLLAKYWSSGNKRLLASIRNFMICTAFIDALYFYIDYTVLKTGFHSAPALVRVLDIFTFIGQVYFWTAYIREKSQLPETKNEKMKLFSLIFCVICLVFSGICYGFLMDGYYLVSAGFQRSFSLFSEVLVCVFLTFITIWHLFKGLSEIVQKQIRRLVTSISIVLMANGLWNAFLVIGIMIGSLDPQYPSFVDPTSLLLLITNLLTIFLLWHEDFTALFHIEEKEPENDINSRLDFIAQTHSLTEREREVLELAYEGLTNPEIADQLIISKYTVKRHMHNIFEKLDISTRMELVHLVNQENGPGGPL
ncbi:helix-turn-helix transcriptional regulator [Anaerovorax odorimutans]|uniref:Helix-turn-helix transcriptional regulator n=1 Tax=Anaerovorax odorimutans TaxID=109327 RepID=A0ABT1RQP3_9FIRM|nr:helix-turn-helix transcriptional regulator [Anaerovorax odorimutans]MCQ4637479.1 helix-turn-helix transcriptional regulator [Anaerovorax odorimutans]